MCINFVLNSLITLRMTKDRSQIYGSIGSSEFFDGILEFYSIAVEHQVRTRGVGFYCPCVKCGNVSKVNSIDILREHILRRGFRPQYQVLVLHGEEGVQKEKSVVEDVDRVDVYETDEENVDEDVDRVDKMIEGVEDELGKCPRVFDLLTEASQKLLYLGYTKFTKLTFVLTIFNIK